MLVVLSGVEIYGLCVFEIKDNLKRNIHVVLCAIQTVDSPFLVVRSIEIMHIVLDSSVGGAPVRLEIQGAQV